ncbi:MAG: DUF63 family protein [Candidatus Micrarchaeota archaeon]
MNFNDFVNEYFLNPINFPDKYAPYNIVNTISFAIIAIAALYFIYKYFSREKIEFNEKLYFAFIPFIFFGSIVRVLSDAAILPRAVQISGITLYPFITPQIYVLMFAITMASLLMCKRLFVNWQTRFAQIGITLAALAILPLIMLFKNFALFAAILAIVAAIALILFYSRWKTTNLEKGIILSQVFDGAATFVGVQFGGYSEQHIVGNAIFSTLGGPWAFLAIKLLFAVAVVYVLRREKVSVNENTFIALVITIFGLAPGLRDALRLLCGV